jgi:hypothetical protein
MSTQSPAKIQATPVTPADELAALDRRLAELQAQDSRTLKRVLELEKTTAHRDDGGADLKQAEALLDGREFVASREVPLSLLGSLYSKRKTIKRALEIGLSRRDRLASAIAAEIWASYGSQIAELERHRIFLALSLQRADREREALREKITRAGGQGILPSDGPEFLGLGHRDDEVAWGAGRLIADGICTKKEIEKVMHG